MIQECIPVGCVPAAHRPYAGGGGGASFRGCLLRGGGASFPGGGGTPACTEADPPVNRITHTSKNITLATTSLRPVIKTNRTLINGNQGK